TGKERDEETGLLYHGSRYSAVWLGRWTSCDPSGIADGLNMYNFVHDRPVIEVDPSGTDGQPWWRFTEAGFQYQTGNNDIFQTQPGYDTGFAPLNLAVNLVVTASNACTIPFNAVTEVAAIPEELARAAGASEQDIEAMNFALMMTGVGEVSALPKLAATTTEAKKLATASTEVKNVVTAATEVKNVATPTTELKSAATTVTEVKNVATTAAEVKTEAAALTKVETSAARVPPEYFDQAISRIDQGELKASGAHLNDLTSHAQSAAARAERGLTGVTGQSAHISAQSAMRNLPGYNPRAALTRLLDATTHQGFDDYWKQVFRQMANASGESSISVSDYFNVMRDAIGNNPHFSTAEANSMVELLRDELFVQHGLAETDLLRLPYSK